MISPLSIYPNKAKASVPSLIFLLGSALIGIAAISFLPQFPVISDSLDLHNVALSIVETGEYAAISADELIYPPLYPFMMALIYLIFGVSYPAVYFVQFLLLGGISATVFAILKRFGVSTLLASIAGVIILIWPYFMLYSLLIASEMLYAFFLLLSMYWLIRMLEGNASLKPAALFGIFLGLAVLARPVALLLPFWLIIGGIILTLIGYLAFEKMLLKRSLIALAMFVIVLLPWTVYAYIKFDRFIPVASNLSHVFTKANESFEYLDQAQAEKPSFVEAKLKNVYLFWNPGASGYNVDMIVDAKPQVSYGLWLYKIGFFAVIILGFIAAYWSRKDLRVAILGMTVLYFWALHTVLFPFPRYTLPIIPIMAILALYSVNKLIPLIWRKKY